MEQPLQVKYGNSQDCLDKLEAVSALSGDAALITCKHSRSTCIFTDQPNSRQIRTLAICVDVPVSSTGSLYSALLGRYAEPGYKMEKEVEEGKLVGSMYGVLPNRDWKEPSKETQAQQMVS